MEAKFCRNCGAPVRPETKFCGACGTQVIRQPKPEPEQNIQNGGPHTGAAAASEYTQSGGTGYQNGAQQTGVKAPPGVRRSAGTVALVVVLCVLIFMWSFAAVSILNVRHGLSAKHVHDVLGSVVNYETVVDLPAYPLIPAADQDETIVEWAADEIEAVYDNSITLSADALEEFLQDSTFLSFINDELCDYILDVLNGTGESGVTTEELESLLEENAEVIGSLFGEEINDHAVAYIIGRVEDDGLMDQLIAFDLHETFPVAYYSIQIGLSVWTAGFFLLVSLLFILLLAKCNRWNIWHTCGDIGVVLTVQVAMMLLATGVTALLPDMWSLMEPVIRLAGAMLDKSLPGTVVLLVAGIVLIVVKAVGLKIAIRSATVRV